MAIFVYRLRCSDGADYIGSHRGEDVANRVADHNAGYFPKAWTYRRRPVELVWAEELASILDAIACERRLKGWSRAKKEALIRGDWVLIQELARGGTPRPSTGSGICRVFPWCLTGCIDQLITSGTLTCHLRWSRSLINLCPRTSH